MSDATAHTLSTLSSTDQDNSALREIVRRLVEAYRPERVYLFGPHARGEAGPDSDYDLLVVVPDAAPPERRRSRLAYEVLWGAGRAADVLVWTRYAFESRVHLRASLPSTVLSEGWLLYCKTGLETTKSKILFGIN